MRRETLFYIFVNLFNVWLNKRQLDSHVCFCIQYSVISSFDWSIWRKSSLTYLCHWKKKEYFIAFQLIWDILLWYYAKTWQRVVSYYWARDPKLLSPCAATTGPTCLELVPQQKKLPQREAHALQLEEAWAQQRKPSRAKNN